MASAWIARRRVMSGMRYRVSPCDPVTATRRGKDRLCCHRHCSPAMSTGPRSSGKAASTAQSAPGARSRSSRTRTFRPRHRFRQGLSQPTGSSFVSGRATLPAAATHQSRPASARCPARSLASFPGAPFGYTRTVRGPGWRVGARRSSGVNRVPAPWTRTWGL